MKTSSGILLYRFRDNKPEIFLVHPGGPFWARKDAGAWSIPKGEFNQGEEPLAAALREFTEETGTGLKGTFIELTPIKQKSGKMVFCFAGQGEIDPDSIKSNTFETEWPPHSGRKSSFPEVDRAGWFSIEEARIKINEAQAAFIDELLLKLGWV